MRAAASFASSAAVRERMQRQARRETDLEMTLRRALHRRGLRYRVQVKVLPRHTADVVFGRARIIVDVRSCFWHHCPDHGGVPTANAEWWTVKLRRTVERDRSTVASLEELGWTVVVVWEHEDADQVADSIARLVRGRAAGT